jgi:hypothetical protein
LCIVSIGPRKQKNSGLFVLSKIFTRLAVKNIKKNNSVFSEFTRACVSPVVVICTQYCCCSYIILSQDTGPKYVPTRLKDKKINIIQSEWYNLLFFFSSLREWKRVGTRISGCWKCQNMHLCRLYYSSKEIM